MKGFLAAVLTALFPYSAHAQVAGRAARPALPGALVPAVTLDLNAVPTLDATLDLRIGESPGLALEAPSLPGTTALQDGEPSVLQGAVLLGKTLTRKGAADRRGDALRRFFDLGTVSRPAALAASLDDAAPQADPVWGRLAAWVEDMLPDLAGRIDLDATQVAAARILRAEPTLRVDTALARALAETHGLQDHVATGLTIMLENDFGLVDEAFKHETGVVNDVREYQGKVYVGGGNGLFVKTGDGLELLTRKSMGAILRIVEIPAGLAVVTPRGAYVKRGRSWRPIWEGEAGSGVTAKSVFQIGKEFFVGTTDGVRRGAFGETAAPEGPKNAHHFIRTRGGFFVGAEGGVFQLGRRAWRTEAQSTEVKDIVVIDGMMHAIREDGIKMQQGPGRWAFWPFDGVGLNRFAEIDGKVYAVGDVGVFSWDGTRWAFDSRLTQNLGLKSLSGAKVMRSAGGHVYFGTKNGLLRWHVPPEGWRERVLDGLAPRIAALGRSAEAAREVPEPGRGEGLKDSRGRTLFNGLGNSKHDLPGAGTSWWRRLLGVLASAAFDLPREEKKDAPKEPELWTLGLDEQIDKLLVKYKVPEHQHRARRGFVKRAVQRIRADIPMILDQPDAEVGYGPWWLTVQSLEDTTQRKILIPVEDIFVRAADPEGVEEAVGAAIHEIAHFSITRFDPKSPLTEKYLLKNSPPENVVLYQVTEDTRINSWILLKKSGVRPYFDKIYEAMWPKDPEKARELQKYRESVLAGTELEVTNQDGSKEGFMPPHLQYTNQIIYWWRHRAKAPFLTDELALEVFEKTKDTLDKLAATHPQEMGGILLEEKKRRASIDMLELMDREIYPEYAKLVERTKDQIEQMQQDGKQVGPPQEGQGQGDQSKVDGDPQQGQPGSGQPTPEQISDAVNREAARRMHDHSQNGSPGDPAQGGQPGQGGKTGAGSAPEAPGTVTDGEGDKWLKQRQKAIAQRDKQNASFTSYEKYKLKAADIGLIGKVDGVLKRVLMPTTHRRLSRSHFHEGDEPDMEKWFDDTAQGRKDTPIMRNWSRKVKKSAKVSLVLDVSGSMGSLSDAMSSPLDYAVIGMVAWMEVAQRNNIDFEVILFAGDNEVVHEFGKPVNKAEKERIIRKIAEASGGSTAIGAAFKKALDRIAPQRSTHKFIIVATDEDHNSGKPPSEYREEAKKAGVVSIAMNLGRSDNEQLKKEFDHAIRVKEPREFPQKLLGVLRDAMKAALGRHAGSLFSLMLLAPFLLPLLRGGGL